MIRLIDINEPLTLTDYASYNHLRHAVDELRSYARAHASRLKGRTVWMVNSTAQGGGVAEMLPKVISLLREVGVATEWVVIDSDREQFFTLTKRLHNMIHGAGEPELNGTDRSVYEAVSHELADALHDRIAPNDLLVVHDPQPLGMGALLKQRLGIPAVWRCHIGLDHTTPTTRAAWDFLKPWTLAYDNAVFTIPAYTPSFLKDRVAIIPPAIDPLSHKNRDLTTHKLAGVLVNSSLAEAHQPVLTPPFENVAQRLQPDGLFAPATQPESLGLLYRPLVTQVSRWDRLKGFAPLLDGFVRLKTRQRTDGVSEQHRRRLELVRLVLAGPDPASVSDDPEGQEVFEGLCAAWQALPPEVQRDVAIIVLPMDSRKHNALMVNALQRCSTVVVQNSLREGFGLTVSEAMWKGRPVLGSRAAGIQAQIEDGIHGRLVENPEDPAEIADTLDGMLAGAGMRETYARNAQRRVADEFLVFAQVRRWIQVLSNLADEQSAPVKLVA